VANAENTRKEAGNLRFDVLQSLSEPTHFILNEVYQSEQAFQDHQKTQHYFTWRETVTDWMAEPRSAVKCGVVFPAEKAEW
jgi:autoinducer 2-degrading protein